MANYVVLRGQLYNADELAHHGIKGMKWGRRRYQNSDGSLTPAGKKRYSNLTGDVMEKKAAYKQAKKDYNKSFNKANNKAIAAFSPIKKHREANDKRWEDVYDKIDRLDKAKSDYKSAKQKETKAIRDTTRKLNKNARLGDKLLYNNATRQKAASYIVKNNMSVEEATKKANGDARRNTAIFVAAYGAIGVASLYKSMN